MVGRPIKEGLDYFPLNVTLSGNIEYIQAMYGKMGEMVIISLWQRIYQKGYYIEYSNMSPLVFSKDFGNQLEQLFPGGKRTWEIFDEIVHKALDFDVFNASMYEKYQILTSKNIQKIYVAAKKKSAEELIDKRYLLLSAP